MEAEKSLVCAGPAMFPGWKTIACQQNGSVRQYVQLKWPLNQLKCSLNHIGVQQETWTELASDRATWRAITHRAAQLLKKIEELLLLQSVTKGKIQKQPT